MLVMKWYLIDLTIPLKSFCTGSASARCAATGGTPYLLPHFAIKAAYAVRHIRYCSPGFQSGVRWSIG